LYRAGRLSMVTDPRHRYSLDCIIKDFGVDILSAHQSTDPLIDMTILRLSLDDAQTIV
jgi:hypothetical protein